MCGNRRWTREEDVALVETIQVVCERTGAPVREVIRRVETLLGPGSGRRHLKSPWSRSGDDVVRAAFCPMLQETGRSPVAAARRARVLLDRAWERAGVGEGARCPS